MVEQVSHREVEFRFFRPAAQRVCLVGDFNGWDRTALPMSRENDAWWTCRIRLAPGVHQFRYIADGEPYLDYAAFGIDRGPAGEWNSVVVIEPQRVASDDRRPARDAVTVGLPDAACDTDAWTACRSKTPAVPANGDGRRAYQLQEI